MSAAVLADVTRDEWRALSDHAGRTEQRRKTIPFVPRDVVDMFLSRVEFGDDSECWAYASDAKAYATVVINGVGFSAHRVAWRIFRGPLPDSLRSVLHHVCQNKRCVNPRHLQALSHRDHQIVHLRLRQEGL